MPEQKPHHGADAYFEDSRSKLEQEKRQLNKEHHTHEVLEKLEPQRHHVDIKTGPSQPAATVSRASQPNAPQFDRHADEMMHKSAEEAKSAFHHTVEAVEDAAIGIERKAMEIVDKVGAKTTHLYNQSIDAVEHGLEKVEHAIDHLKGNENARVSDRVESVAHKVEDGFKETKEWLRHNLFAPPERAPRSQEEESADQFMRDFLNLRATATDYAESDLREFNRDMAMRRAARAATAGPQTVYAPRYTQMPPAPPPSPASPEVAGASPPSSSHIFRRIRTRDRPDGTTQLEVIGPEVADSDSVSPRSEAVREVVSDWDMAPIGINLHPGTATHPPVTTVTVTPSPAPVPPSRTARDLEAMKKEAEYVAEHPEAVMKGIGHKIAEEAHVVEKGIREMEHKVEDTASKAYHAAVDKSSELAGKAREGWDYTKDALKNPVVLPKRDAQMVKPEHPAVDEAKSALKHGKEVAKTQVDKARSTLPSTTQMKDQAADTWNKGVDKTQEALEKVKIERTVRYAEVPDHERKILSGFWGFDDA